MTRKPEKVMIKRHKRNKMMPEDTASAWDTLYHVEASKAIPRKGEVTASKLQSCSTASGSRAAAGVPRCPVPALQLKPSHLPAAPEHMGSSRMETSLCAAALPAGLWAGKGCPALTEGQAVSRDRCGLTPKEGTEKEQVPKNSQV